MRRTRYFDGRILTAEDFEREQTYLLDRWRRHNRFMHGWGVVTGLDVELGRGSREIEVSPGIAIDCAGNEIVVPDSADEHARANQAPLGLACNSGDVVRELALRSVNTTVLVRKQR